MPFNSQGTGDFIPYADSDVRNFLVNDFEKNAFSPDELKSIIRKTIECTVYCFDETKRDGFYTVSKKEEIRVANKTSSDRVFLLSVGEVEKYFGLKHGDSVEREIKFNIAINKYDNILLRSQEWNTRTYTSSYTTRVDQHSYNSSSLMKCSSENKVMLQSGGYGGSFAIRPAIWVDMLTSEEHAEIEKKERERKAREEKERQERERLEQQRLALERKRREDGVCQYCGGDFKGLFIKKCAVCGRRKDY